jgi:outer membrane protein TolC
MNGIRSMNGIRILLAGLLFSLTAAAQSPQNPPPAPPQESQQPMQIERLPTEGLRKVTLREALQIAGKQSPDVAIARAQAAIAHAQVDKAWTAWQPDISASGTFDHTNAIAIIPPSPLSAQPLTITAQNNWYGNAQVVQPLFTAQGVFGPGAAKAGAESADRGADQAREQVLLQVSRAYLGLQGLAGILQAARDLEKVALRREDDAKARIAAGTDVELALLRAQTDTATARVNIANTLGQMQSFLPLLIALVGEPIVPEPVGPGPQLAVAPGDVSEEPWENAYSVKSARLQITSVERLVRLDQFNWLPQVAGVAKESYTSNEGFVGKNWTYDLMINASLPIYDRGQRIAQLHEDEAKLAQAQATLASTRAKAKADWVSSKANLVAAQAVLDQSIAQEEFAARAQVQVDVSARAGVATSLDLSDADQRKFAAQSNVAQARAALEIRKAEIAASAGQLYVIAQQ